VPPEAILFIDDQSDYVEAARGFGWNTIQFETPSKLRTQLNLAFGVQVPQPSTGALGRGRLTEPVTHQTDANKPNTTYVDRSIKPLLQISTISRVGSSCARPAYFGLPEFASWSNNF
jgi:FMN phosphatase YigB (HAD superfamily)